MGGMGSAGGMGGGMGEGTTSQPAGWAPGVTGQQAGMNQFLASPRGQALFSAMGLGPMGVPQAPPQSPGSAAATPWAGWQSPGSIAAYNNAAQAGNASAFDQAVAGGQGQAATDFWANRMAPGQTGPAATAPMTWQNPGMAAAYDRAAMGGNAPAFNQAVQGGYGNQATQFWTDPNATGASGQAGQAGAPGQFGMPWMPRSSK